MDEPSGEIPQRQQKRGWFQFHLSTAIAPMLTAGVLIWANFFNGREWQPPTVGWPDIFLSSSVSPDPTAFHYHWLIFDLIVAVLILIVVGFIFEARAWGWRGGKIFVWAFIGVAIELQIITNIRALIITYYFQ
ncbi:MAG TPA: hypothetical protein VKX17_22940 [Planctomycetota bacterium]|nr:hypothetical protein [Planctomycetota bacterium]